MNRQIEYDVYTYPFDFRTCLLRCTWQSLQLAKPVKCASFYVHDSIHTMNIFSIAAMMGISAFPGYDKFHEVSIVLRSSYHKLEMQTSAQSRHPSLITIRINMR